MANRNLNLLKGSLTVIIFATLVFVVIFFFFPDVSVKYFGDAFNKEKAVENSLVSLVYNVDYMSDDEKAVFEDYLRSEEGKEMVKAISNAADKGRDAVESVMESPQFKEFSSSVKNTLSPESLSRLLDEASSSAEALFNRIKK